MNDEQLASFDLDTAGYAGKWKKAQELALHNDGEENHRILPYWERVRLIFLELGGQYINQHGKAQP